MNLSTLFTEPEIVNKIQNKLPELFQMAELESQPACKIGMEIGSLFKRITLALVANNF